MKLTSFLASLFLATFAYAEKPNILLITADDLGLQLSCYGDPYIETPHLDALAESGVRFETAYVTQASCSSSRSSMFTGLFPHTTGQIGLANGGFQLNPSQVGQNLPAYLKKANYRTGILGKLHVSPEPSFPFDFRPPRQDTRDMKAVAANAKKFLTAPDDAPFFLMVNYADPHVYKDHQKGGPGYFPNNWKGLPEYRIPPDTVPSWDFQGVDEPIARQRASNFYNTVKRLDAGIGMLLNELDASGEKENTLVIFLGDHGPPFNRAKTTCYESGLRVPFLVRWPGVSKAGIASDALVSAADIVPTILDAAGIEFPHKFHGVSLRPAVTESAAPENWRKYLAGEHHFHGYGGFFPRRAIRDDRFKLIHNLLAGKPNPTTRVDSDPIEKFAVEPEFKKTPAGKAYARYQNPPAYELYDLEADPVEFYNLADDPEHSETLTRMKAALLDWRKETADPLLDESKIAVFEKKGKTAEARVKKK